MAWQAAAGAWIGVLGQGLLGLIVFTAPGIALLYVLHRRRMPAWPLPALLGASFVLSSIAVSLWQMASLRLLPPTGSRVAAWVLVAATVVLEWRPGWRIVRESWGQAGPWERRSAWAVAAAVGFWLLTMPLSPYPSVLTMQLADAPSYIQAAKSLVAGHGWEPGFFDAFHVGGKMAYIETHPIQALATTCFFHVFGTNSYSFHVYNVVAAGLLIVLLVSVVRGAPGAVARDGRHVLLLTLAAVALPAHFALFGLGAHTVPSALGLLTLMAFAAAPDLPLRTKGIVIGACLLFMLLMRPEAALLAGLLALVYAIRLVVERLCTNWRRRVAGGVGGVALVLLVWWSLPSVTAGLARKGTLPFAFFVKLDPGTGRFAALHDPWWHLNRELGRVNFTGENVLETLGNPAIGSEVRAHPIAFLGWLAGQFPRLAKVFLRAVTVAQFPLDRLEGLPSVALLAILLVLAAMEPAGRVLVGAVVAFLFVIPAVNPDIGARHMLTFSPAVLALAIRPVWRWSHGAVRRLASKGGGVAAAAALCLLALAFLDGWSIIRVRGYWPNRCYVNVLKDIERVSAPGDLVATTFPSLVTCVTGRRTVGGPWIVGNLDRIIERWHPDVIYVGSTPGTPCDYERLIGPDGKLFGYVPVVRNEEEGYTIFRCPGYEARPP